MFETDAFREQLQTAIAEEIGVSRMDQYQMLIVYLLWMMARNNEDRLMQRELSRPSGYRRGIPDALLSARELIKSGSEIARRENRTLLTVNDVVAAYQARYCGVWPFCR